MIALRVITLLYVVMQAAAVSIKNQPSQIVYDPMDPENPRSLNCLNDGENVIWTRNDLPFRNNTANPLLLDINHFGTDCPQEFEGLYRCADASDNSDKSDPVFVYVLPQQIPSTEQHVSAIGDSVTIPCPLKFGSLYMNYTVEWRMDGKRLRTKDKISISRYPEDQLTINSVPLEYNGAKFTCEAHFNSRRQPSQAVNLTLFANVTIESLGPENPVVVPANGNATVRCQGSGFPAPTITWGYNATCNDTWDTSRIEVTHNNSGESVEYSSNFILRNMREGNSGEVTCTVTDGLHGNSTVTRKVSLFVLYKPRVESVKNRTDAFGFFLRAPIDFDYQIEFINAQEKRIAIVNGNKGERNFSVTVPELSGKMDLKARFKIGKFKGPPSESLPVSPEQPGDSPPKDNDTVHIVIIVSVVCVAVLLLALIICLTILTVKKWRQKSNKSGNSENGENHRNQAPEIGTLTVHPPTISYQDATPNGVHGNRILYPPYPGHMAPNLQQQPPHFGSSSSKYSRSSVGSRKSSVGYESGTASVVYMPCPHCASAYPVNYMCHVRHPSDHYDHGCQTHYPAFENATPVFQHHPQYIENTIPIFQCHPQRIESAIPMFQHHPQHIENAIPMFQHHPQRIENAIPVQHSHPQHTGNDETEYASQHLHPHSCPQQVSQRGPQLAQPSSIANSTNARPPLRRNVSDPSISRHKQQPCRMLERQRTVLSSSSVA